MNHVLKIFSFTFTNKMNIQEDSAPSQLSNGTLLSLIRPPQVKLQLAKKGFTMFSRMDRGSSLYSCIVLLEPLALRDVLTDESQTVSVSYPTPGNCLLLTNVTRQGNRSTNK